MDPWIPPSSLSAGNFPLESMKHQGMSRLGRTIALVGLFLAPLQAQTSQVQLDLGMDVAGPGQHVSIPVTLAPVADSTITRLVLEATFSGEKLSYVETLPGAAAEAAAIEMDARIIEPEGGDPARLRVEIISTQGLPAGELARLSFQISEEAELNEDIMVTNVSRSVETREGEPQVDGSDGIVTVITNAFFACFFYMH